MVGDYPREEFKGARPGGAVLLGVEREEPGLVQLGQPAPGVEVGGVPTEGLKKGLRPKLERVVEVTRVHQKPELLLIEATSLRYILNMRVGTGFEACSNPSNGLCLLAELAPIVFRQRDNYLAETASKEQSVGDNWGNQ